MQKKDDQITALIEPGMQDFKCNLWGVECLVGRYQNCIRIYIDSPTGIDIKDCEEVSRYVSALLDAEDLMTRQYTLEVSSPGLERRLFNIEQYLNYINEPIKMTLHFSVDGRRKLKGIIQSVDVEQNQVTIVENEVVFIVPALHINHAQLIFDIKKKKTD